MMFKMTEPRYEPNPTFWNARWKCCSSCTPTTSRTAARAAMRRHWQLPLADPYCSLDRRGCGALYGPLHGGANQAVLQMLTEIGSVANVPIDHQEREERRAAADGVWTPGLQVVRPAREDHQAHRGPGLRGDRSQPAPRHRAGARAHRPAGRVLRGTSAVSERRLLFGPDLRGDGLPARHVSRCCLRSRERPGGSRSGRRCSSTTSNTSPGPGSSTPARADATTCRARSAVSSPW